MVSMLYLKLAGFLTLQGVRVSIGVPQSVTEIQWIPLNIIFFFFVYYILLAVSLVSCGCCSWGGMAP